MNILKAENIVKNYQDVDSELHILRGIDINIDSSDLIALTGPSGCGKSTLLHILGLLDSASSGDIYYFGEKVNHQLINESKFRNKHIGFVFQFHYLMNDFTAVENIALPAYIGGTSWYQALKEAKELLKRFDLLHRANHYPNQLSGGEQQRIAISRALINHPDLIFADEPTGNLDIHHAEEIIKFIKEVNKEFGQGFLIATHDQNIYTQMNKHYRLDNGKLLYE
jgi:lipoprotein-releasing system ATP-binding protein